MVELRLQKVSDAERFFEILNNPNFIYFDVQPATIEDEVAWLEQNAQRMKDNTQWNYTILYDEAIVGAIGVQINYHRNYIGEIGYFIDEKYWNLGIATQAVKLIEEICRNELKLTRIEIAMLLENSASERVAFKNNYLKEGIQRKLIKGKDGQMKDCYLYAKVF